MVLVRYPCVFVVFGLKQLHQAHQHGGIGKILTSRCGACPFRAATLAGWSLRSGPVSARARYVAQPGRLASSVWLCPDAVRGSAKRYAESSNRSSRESCIRSFSPDRAPGGARNPRHLPVRRVGMPVCDRKLGRAQPYSLERVAKPSASQTHAAGAATRQPVSVGDRRSCAQNGLRQPPIASRP